MQIALGLALSATIGGLAYRWGALSGSGVAGAVLLGTTILGMAGWPWAILLVVFFTSSSLLSRFGRRRKRLLLEETAKGSRRDLIQTLANAAIAGLLASIAGVIGPEAAIYPALALAFAGALAAANADTWATELGVLAAQQPRLITSGQRVSPGSSGGVTLVGTLAALAGATFVGLAAALLGGVAALPRFAWLGWPPSAAAVPGWIWIFVVAIAGLAGALLDSLLGATVQATYYCAVCDTRTERPVHRCGQATQLVRGQRWINNDAVNFLATTLAAAMAGLLAAWLL